MSIFLIAVAFMASLALSQGTLTKRMADEDSPNFGICGIQLTGNECICDCAGYSSLIMNAPVIVRDTAH